MDLRGRQGRRGEDDHELLFGHAACEASEKGVFSCSFCREGMRCVSPEVHVLCCLCVFVIGKFDLPMSSQSSLVTIE